MHTIRTHTAQRTTICSTYKRTQKQNTDTETNIPNTQNNAQPQHTEQNTYDLHKYNFDIYHEYVAIKNSNTIELYTISKD